MNMLYVWRGRLPALIVVTAAMLEPRAAAAEVVTLQGLETLALQNQARWKAVEATKAEASAEVDAARAARMPTFWMNVMSVVAPGSDIEQVLTVDGREVNVRASPSVRESTAFRPNVRYEASIDMRAPIYDGQTRASLRAARAYRAAAEASSAASRETVVTMVRAAYLDWLATYMAHGFAENAAEEAKAQGERVAARVDDGERPPSELDTASYQELQTELAASEALARLEDARRLLESAVGAELPPDAAPNTDLLAIDSFEEDPRETSEVEMLELRRNAARDEAEAFRKTRAPVLAIVGRTGLTGINETVFPSYQLGLNLAVPLWDGGRAVALAHAADARASELDARARDARLENSGAREQAAIDREQAEAHLAIANRLVAVSEKRVDHAQTSYDLGAGSLEAMSDARAALRDTRSRRAQLQVARADAMLRLKPLAAQ